MPSGAATDLSYTFSSDQWGLILGGSSGFGLATARKLATAVEILCKQTLGDSNGDSTDDYWPRATLAEAALILGDLNAARDRYAAAASLIGDRYGDLGSTRQQARMLLEHLGESAEWLNEVMRIPPVIVYTGHMIDAPERATSRFLPSMEAAVRDEILQRLEGLRPVAAYGSAACGADHPAPARHASPHSFW